MRYPRNHFQPENCTGAWTPEFCENLHGEKGSWCAEESSESDKKWPLKSRQTLAKTSNQFFANPGFDVSVRRREHNLRPPLGNAISHSALAPRAQGEHNAPRETTLRTCRAELPGPADLRRNPRRKERVIRRNEHILEHSCILGRYEVRVWAQVSRPKFGFWRTAKYEIHV